MTMTCFVSLLSSPNKLVCFYSQDHGSGKDKTSYFCTLSNVLFPAKLEKCLLARKRWKM